MGGKGKECGAMDGDRRECGAMDGDRRECGAMDGDRRECVGDGGEDGARSEGMRGDGGGKMEGQSEGSKGRRVYGKGGVLHLFTVN